MTNDKKLLLGSALAAFVAAGCSSMGGMGMKKSEGGSSKMMSPTGTMVAMGECSGINSCKGQGECGGAGHSCKGKNDCKGKGWISASQDDCKGKGGTWSAK